ELHTRRYLQSLQHSKGFGYAHSNKGDKFLAHLLKGNTPCTQVCKLRLSLGTMSSFPNDIAEEFRRYYHSIYNLSAPDGNTKSTKINDYLDTNVTKTVSPEFTAMLDAQIGVEELSAALNCAKAGRAPFPSGFSMGYYKNFSSVLLP
ncbi:Hypothetical predicted protein, partial [Pelobates cultripes]